MKPEAISFPKWSSVSLETIGQDTGVAVGDVGGGDLFGLYIVAVKPIGHHVPFSLKCSDGKTRWVSNMDEENFSRLRRGGLKFPILLRETKHGFAGIIDLRIKAKWLRPNTVA